MNINQFIKEIAIPEFKSVIGKNGSRVIILTFILFISLLVLGLANSSNLLLKDKMNDPFINFIDVNVPFTTIEGKQKFTKNSAKELVKDTSYLKPNFSKVIIKIRDFRIKDKKAQLKGMLLTEDDLFYKDLINKKGDEKILLTENKFSDSGFGIIVTLDFFKSLGIKDESWKTISFVEIKLSNGKYPVMLPIAAVVKELRNNCKFAGSINLFNTESNDIDKFKPTYDLNKNQKVYFIPESKEVPNSYKKKLNPNLSDNCHIKGDLVYTRDLSIDSSKIGYIEVFDLSGYEEIEAKYYPSFFSFFLKDLNAVEKLSNKMLLTYGIEIEQSKIKSKKNFAFFETITNLLYYTLTLFSILAIILFIVNILISHLERNKRSLGTLKAFGLSNNYILGLYSGITLFLVSCSFIFAYILSEILGPLSIKLFVYVGNIDNEFVSDFKFINQDLEILILSMVIIPSIWILIRVFKYLYNVTPGDLIYERK